jgi:hypothetical protein
MYSPTLFWICSSGWGALETVTVASIICIGLPKPLSYPTEPLNPQVHIITKLLFDRSPISRSPFRPHPLVRRVSRAPSHRAQSEKGALHEQWMHMEHSENLALMWDQAISERAPLDPFPTYSKFEN